MSPTPKFQVGDWVQVKFGIGWNNHSAQGESGPIIATHVGYDHVIHEVEGVGNIYEWHLEGYKVPEYHEDLPGVMDTAKRLGLSFVLLIPLTLLFGLVMYLTQ